MLYEQKEKGTYLNVGNEREVDGTIKNASFRLTVTEDTPGAVRRDWESPDKTKNGTKWEKHYAKVDGTITALYFYEGDFGKNLIVTLNDGGEELSISLSVESEYGKDLMKKIPNIDMSQKVSFAPYAWMDEKSGKPRKCITVMQGDKKIQTHFYDFHTKKSLNGYPEYEFKIDKKTGERKSVSTAEWKIFFAQCNLWLVEYIEEHHLMKPKDNALDDAAKDRAKVDEIYDGLDDPEAEPAF